MLMAADALLDAHPHPTEAEVQDALGGVLCRCTGYRKIVEAVPRRVAARRVPRRRRRPAPAPRSAPGSPASTASPRSPARAFGADAAPAGALRCGPSARRTPHARFDLGDLGALPPRIPGSSASSPPPTCRARTASASMPTGKDQPVLADGYVRYRGEAVVALVGDAETVARDRRRRAADRLDAAAAAASSSTRADGRRARPAPRRLARQLLAAGRVVPRRRRGRPRPRRVDRRPATFETVHVEHAYIEPEAGYARAPTATGSRSSSSAPRRRTWTATRSPSSWASRPSGCSIIPSACGGGFGGKLDLSRAAARRRSRRWILERPGALRLHAARSRCASTTKRHPARITRALGADADGRLTAIDFHGDFDTGAYASWGPTVANRVPVHASGPYVVPRASARPPGRSTRTARSAARSAASACPQAAIAQEALLDDLAAQLGIDRLEIRLPQRAAGRVDARRPARCSARAPGSRACLEALRPAWDRGDSPRPPPCNAGAAAGDRRSGAASGIGAMWYGIGNTSLPNPSTIRIGLRRDGTYVLSSGAQEIGQGSNTVMTQIAADALGVPLAQHRAASPATPTGPPMPARPRPRARRSCRAMPPSSPPRTSCA